MVTPPSLVCSKIPTKRSCITCREPRAGARRLVIVQPCCGSRWCKPALPALACGRINSGSPSLGPATESSWWKPARTWPIPSGPRSELTHSPADRPISAPASGQIIQVASTAFARRDMRIVCETTLTRKCLSELVWVFVQGGLNERSRNLGGEKIMTAAWHASSRNYTIG